MFPGCGCVRFVFVFFLYFFFLCAFIYNLMISGTHLLAPSLSLVISYNEDGYNEDDVRQLLRAPDFEDIWSQLFRLASAYHRAKKKKKRVSDFYHNGSECAPYCAHEPVSSSSQKAKFFFILLAGAKMYCKDVKVSSSYMFLFACTYACVTAWGSRVV